MWIGRPTVDGGEAAWFAGRVQLCGPRRSDSAVALRTKLFRRRVASAIPSQWRRRTPAGSRRSRTRSQLRRTQDQLHIHVGCLGPPVLRAIAAAAPHVPIGGWQQLGAIVQHRTFWGTRVNGTDLADVDPVRLAIGALADKVTDLSKVMIVVAGVGVAGEDGFLILTTYAGALQSWPVGADRRWSGHGSSHR